MHFLSVGEIPTDKKLPAPLGQFSWPKAREFMENRYLAPARQKPLRRGEGPILHENISLTVLPACRQAGVSRTSPGFPVICYTLCSMRYAITHEGEPACAKPRLQKPCGGQALRRRQVGGENCFEC